MLFIFVGSKEQCEKSVLLIQKSNKNSHNNIEPLEDADSSSSSELVIDEGKRKSGDVTDDSEESEDENQVLTNVSKSPQTHAEAVENNNSPISTITTSSNTCTVSSVQPTTVSSYSTGESH